MAEPWFARKSWPRHHASWSSWSGREAGAAVRKPRKAAVEVVPFGLPLCERRLRELGLSTRFHSAKTGSCSSRTMAITSLIAEIAPIAAPTQLEQDIIAIPGVVDSGLFLGMATVVLIGDSTEFRLIEERRANVKFELCVAI